MIPTTCPACGAYSLTAADETSRLLLVCDVLVVKALERVGNRIVRSQRSRFRELENFRLPLHEAHTLWPAPQDMACKALAGSWDVIPALLSQHNAMVVGVDPQRVIAVLDDYVHALVENGQGHDVVELACVLRSRLALAVPVAQ